MPISSNQYVEITSVVGGASAVSARKLQLRLITTNDLVPTGSVISFADADSVLSYFGSSTSDEYKQALQYFSLIDKAGNSPDSIQFARWADSDTSAQVFGSESESLATLQAVTSGAFDVTLNGATFSVTGLDFSSATAYADVATALQTAIQALDASLSSSTVAYNSTRSGFDLDTNGTSDGAISFTEVTVGFLDDLGWSSLAIYSEGVSAETLTEMASSLTEINNNYGSFVTVDQLSLSEHVELATWNASQNVMFQYYPRMTKTEAITWQDDLYDYAGCGSVLYSTDNVDEYPWLHPAAELAAIDWDDTGAIKNFMYTQDSTQTAVITTTSEKTTYDAIGANYFGVTQEAGTNLTFFQNGILGGGSSDPRQMGVYAGEQWLKAEAKSQFLNMFLALPIVSADDEGRAIATQYIEAFKQKAVDNGVISVGKTLSTTQKAYITQITGDSDAWQSVQRQGYYFTTEISEETNDSVTEYTIEYTFIYAKRDGVGKVEGSHVLI
jgi:hypothetical protein